MSEIKHTPWCAEGPDFSGHWSVRGKDARGHAGPFIAHEIDDEGPARLLAAAPELMGFCEKLATFPLTDSEEARGDNFLLYAREGRWTLTVGDVKAARAAIAKAKGETA